MRVTATIDSVYLDGDYADAIEGTSATCTRCGHSIESYGTSEASEKRCLVRLREECPRGESNFYVAGS